MDLDILKHSGHANYVPALCTVRMLKHRHLDYSEIVDSLHLQTNISNLIDTSFTPLALLVSHPKLIRKASSCDLLKGASKR